MEVWSQGCLNGVQSNAYKYQIFLSCMCVCVCVCLNTSYMHTSGCKHCWNTLIKQSEIPNKGWKFCCNGVASGVLKIRRDLRQFFINWLPLSTLWFIFFCCCCCFCFCCSCVGGIITGLFLLMSFILVSVMSSPARGFGDGVMGSRDGVVILKLS